MIKQSKLNKLTTIFGHTPCIVIYTKGALTKGKVLNNDRVVTGNISDFRWIPKNTGFPSNTSDEWDNDFKFSRHESNDNHKSQYQELSFT